MSAEVEWTDPESGKKHTIKLCELVAIPAVPVVPPFVGWNGDEVSVGRDCDMRDQDFAWAYISFAHLSPLADPHPHQKIFDNSVYLDTDQITHIRDALTRILEAADE